MPRYLSNNAPLKLRKSAARALIASGIFLIAGTGSSVNPELDRSMTLKVNSETIDRLLNLKIEDNRSFDDYVSGVFLRGTLLTNARVKMKVRPDGQRAALDIIVDAETTSQSIGYSKPTPRLKVDVSFSTHSRANTVKTLYFDADRGISSAPATSQARTTMKIHNINTWASGLFRRLKRRFVSRIAWKKLMEEKANQEAMISRRVESEINSMVDAKVSELTASANKEFQRYFLDGFVARGRLPGPLYSQTVKSGLWLTGWAPKELVAIPDPELNSANRGPISIHANAVMLNHFMESLMGGVDFLSGELAEIVSILRQQPPPSQPNSQFRIYLQKNNPVELRFNDDAITLRIIASKLVNYSGDRISSEEPGAILEAKLKVQYLGENKISVKREGTIDVLPVPPSSEPSPTVRQLVTYYFNGTPGIDATIDLNALNAKISKFGAIEIKGLKLLDDWFLLESDFHPAPQNISPAKEQL